MLQKSLIFEPKGVRNRAKIDRGGSRKRF
jgi:hypothetical protein